VGRAIVASPSRPAGRIRFPGEDLASARGRAAPHARRHIQLIFQDPYASLNRA
jgi:ABC-type microcin C transport system duplicated ATPase subunit YejF